MRLQIWLPASLFHCYRISFLFLSLSFFLFCLPLLQTNNVLAATWQRVENFPVTNVGAITTTGEELYIGTNQSIFPRLKENGFYKVSSEGNVLKIQDNQSFVLSDLALADNAIYGSFHDSTNLGGPGIYKTSDGGSNWEKLIDFLHSPRALAANDEILLAATHDSLWLSIDNGISWEKKLTHSTQDPFNEIFISPSAVFASSNQKLYRSTDNGQNWQSLPISQPVRHIASAGNVVLVGGATGGLMRSTNNGDTWQVLYPSNTLVEHPFGPFVFENSSHVFAGGYKKGTNGYTGTIYESTDGGLTWQNIDEGITHDITSTQEITGLTIMQGKLYMSMYQDGIFVRQITEPQQANKLPVVLIPGIGGSEFEAKEAIASTIHDCNNDLTVPLKYDKSETVWVNETKAAVSRCDDYFDVLKLKADGQTEEYPQIGLKGTIYDRSYGKAIKFFQENGYTLDKDLFIFPYDWRKDIRLTSPLLNAKVDDILSKSGSNKVNIVAHSMGGLVAREYIRDATQAAKVDTLVELGVPHFGATDALASLLYGKCFGPKISNICGGVSPVEVEDISQNATGVYELINSKKYHDTSTLLPFRDDRDIDENGVIGVLDYQQLNTLLTNLNKNIASNKTAEEFHNDLGDYEQTNDVKVYLIVGSGIPTLGQIREYQKTRLGFIKSNKRDQVSINGDGTVPLVSASLNQIENVFYARVEHGALIQSDNVLRMTQQVLNSDINPVSGIQKTPFTLKGKVVSTHSPVELHAYDEIGNHTGPTVDGKIEENIPESSYSTLADASFISLPEEGRFGIVTHATAPGEFDLKVKEYKDDTVAKETLYLDIPQTAETTTTLLLDSKPNNLSIDGDNDGNKDKEVAATNTLVGGQVFDFEAPITKINMDGKDQSEWYKSDVKVSLASDDGSGTGILKTEYSLDSWQTTKTYTEPITISNEGVTNIYFRSIDKAGNEETPRMTEVKIDKTAPELIIKFDIEKKQFIGFGEDHGSGIKNIDSTNSAYLAQDVAGNETRLNIDIQNEPNQEKDNGVSMNITALSYDGRVVEVPETNLKVSWRQKEGILRKLTQSFSIKKQEKILARYNIEKDRGTIIEKEKGEQSIKINTTSLVILLLRTEAGKLVLNF